MTMTQRNHPRLNHDLFANLPLEIIIDILSKLPVRTIISCKCVCKSWLEIVETHLSKVFPAIAVYGDTLDLCKIFDFGDVLDIEHHERPNNPVIKFNLPYRGAVIDGSASGLLFLVNRKTNPHSLYVCNPITRDYIELPSPQEFVIHHMDVVTYGFGVSKINGQHKVVRIYQNYVSDPKQSPYVVSRKSECECHVYTVGTGSWRRVAPVASLVFDRRMDGAFLLNGNLHWLVSGLKGSRIWIFCFDVETEVASTFSPPFPIMEDGRFQKVLFALGDCLCLCDNGCDDKIVIWSMKKYGVEKSWTMEYVINKHRVVSDALFEEIVFGVVYPIKVLRNGDLLLVLAHYVLLYYSKKSGWTQKFGVFEPHRGIDACLYTPSLLSLQSFGMENVSSFRSPAFQNANL